MWTLLGCASLPGCALQPALVPIQHLAPCPACACRPSTRLLLPCYRSLPCCVCCAFFLPLLPSFQVGSVTMEQVREIAAIKLPDLNCTDLEAACNTVAGTARNMGITVEA